MHCNKHENTTDSFQFKSYFVYQLDIQPLQHSFLELMTAAYSHHVVRGAVSWGGMVGVFSSDTNSEVEVIPLRVTFNLHTIFQQK